MSDMNDFIIENGVLKRYVGPGGDVVIPDGVTGIGVGGFWSCDSVTSVTIPESLTSIGDRAFDGCSALKKIYFTNLVAWMGISGLMNLTDHNRELYLNGEPLREIVIPKGLTSISEGAFYGCRSLKKIYISDLAAWVGISGLHSLMLGEKELYLNGELLQGEVVIPDGVTSIKESAFSGCSGLTSVTIPDSVTCIGDWAFFSCKSLKSVTIGDGVKSIGDDAFSCCDKLTSVTIPESVTSIGSSTFSVCSCLTSVTIPDSVVSIGTAAFECCRKLSHVKIGNNVKSIGKDAFSSCSRLTSVTIPNSVTSIGAAAFSFCDELTEMTIPNGVTSIEDGTFERCFALKCVSLPQSIKSIGRRAFDTSHALDLRIGQYDFVDSNLEEIACSGDEQIFSRDAFGGHYPKKLLAQLRDQYWANLTDGALKDLVLIPEVWSVLSEERKLAIYFSRQGKTLLPAYLSIINEQDAQAIAERFVGVLSSAPSVKDCNSAASFMTAFSEKAPTTLLQTMYDLLKKTKNGKKACQTIEKDGLLMRKLV